VLIRLDQHTVPPTASALADDYAFVEKAEYAFLSLDSFTLGYK
jgi:hypothetical protein